jgi:hypothetical protein
VIHIVFAKPAGAGPGWEKTDIWEKASAVTGARLFVDDGGRETLRFGASASGQVLLFGENGGRLFRGGITRARGHSGENAGASAILAMLDGNEAPLHTSSVFGCSLLGKTVNGN